MKEKEPKIKVKISEKLEAARKAQEAPLSKSKPENLKKEKLEKESKLLELELKLRETRKELAQWETKKIKTEEEKKKLEKVKEKYKEIRKEYFLEKKVSKEELYKEILKEQEKFIEEKERNLSSKKRFLYKLFDNKVMRAYLRVPREYRWVGYAALGSAVLLGGGAGWAAAGSYFGLKLSRYIVGSFTSASAIKAVNAFEEYYGTKLNKALEKKVNETLKKESLSTKLDTLLNFTDNQLEKTLKFKKKVNYAKAVAGIAGFLAGYGLTESIAKGVGELLETKAEMASKAEMVAKKVEIGEKVSPKIQPYIETVHKGDSVWKITKRVLEKKIGKEFDFLDEGQKRYLIDAIKDKIAANPEKFGLSEKNIDLIHPGEKINFSPIFEDKEFLKEIFKKAKDLSLKEKVHILSNVEISDKEETIFPERFSFKETRAHLSSFEPIKENFGLRFEDVNGDGVPDKAYFGYNNNVMIKEILFKGDASNLKEISNFIKETREYAKEIAQYPEELFHHPGVLSQVLKSKEFYEDLKIIAKGSNWKEAIEASKLTGGNLGLLIDSQGKLDSSQFEILKGLKDYEIVKPEKIQKLLSFSRELKDNLPTDKKLTWVLLKENPEKFKDFIDVIDKSIDPTKIKEIHWEENNLAIKINRKLWFDKIVKLPAPLKS